MAITVAVAIASCTDRLLRDRDAPPPTSTPTGGTVRTSGTDADRRTFDRKSARVTHVADGDTIEVDLDDAEPPVRVRLLGVDSPELVGNAADFARRAKEYASARCGGQRVVLRLDELQRSRDKYGRLLAYVYLPNNEMLNEALVRDGMAFAYRVEPCDFTSLFESAESQAREAKRGMWRTITREQMPEWRKRWMDERGMR